MSFEDFPTENEASENSSTEEQELRLQKLLATNMRRIIEDRDFFSKLKERFIAIHKREPNSNDLSLEVTRTTGGHRLPDNTWQESENLYVSFTSNVGDGTSVSSYVGIADRIQTDEGIDTVPKDGFTLEQAQMVGGMVDELLLAKMSGQIPNLHQYELSRIYIPTTGDRHDR